MRGRRYFLFSWLIVAVATASAAAPGDDTAALLTVYDTAEQTGPAIAAPRPDFHHTLRIRVTPPATGSRVLRIEASPLAGPDGGSVQPQLRSGSVTGTAIALSISEAGVEQIDIAASLTKAGDYAGWITLAFPDHAPMIRALRINRINPALPIEVVAPERVRTEGCGCGWRSADLWLTLQPPPAGGDFKIRAQITALDRIVTGQQKYQASAVTSVFRLDGAKLDGDADLQGETTRRLRLTLSGFGQPGEYSGNLRVSAQNYTSIDRPFILVIRDPCWLAGLLIALGCVASVLLKRYGSDVRPRLILRRRVALLLTDMQAIATGQPSPDDTEQGVLDQLEQRVSGITARMEDPEALPADWLAKSQVTLEQLRAKLDAFVAWANSRRQLASRPVPTRNTELRARLSAVEVAIVGDPAISEEALAELRKLPQEIADAFRQELAGKIAQFRELVSTQQGKVDSSLTSDPAWGDIFTKLDGAQQLIDSDDLDGARLQLESARLPFLKLQARDLLLRVQAGIPDGASQTSWPAAQSEILMHLEAAQTAATADVASASYENAYRSYLRLLIEPLITLPEAELAQQKASAKLPPADVPAFQALLRETADLAKVAETLRIQSQLREAFAKYEEAQSKWRAARKFLPPGVQMGHAAIAGQPAVSGTEAPGVEGVTAAIRLRWKRGLREDDAALLAKRTRMLDSVVDSLALVVSVLLGIIYVWDANATWGGIADYILAFLWGLGLHQVAGFTFEGVLGVRKKLVE